jgi:nucleotide-binding universal stress UspA family protein
MKRILIALDYDPTAQKVAETGFTLCKEIGDEVTLLHVIESPTYYTSGVYNPIMGFAGYMTPELVETQGLDHIIKGTVEYLQKTKEHLGHREIRTLVKEGIPGEIILSTAMEIKADIIVMGSHSRRWLEKVLMGSITEYVLHHTPVPLFIVPTKKQGGITGVTVG